jgi:hypothetical protein
MLRTLFRSEDIRLPLEIELSNEEILAQLEPMWFGPGAEPGQGRTR